MLCGVNAHCQNGVAIVILIATIITTHSGGPHLHKETIVNIINPVVVITQTEIFTARIIHLSPFAHSPVALSPSKNSNNNVKSNHSSKNINHHKVESSPAQTHSSGKDCTAISNKSFRKESSGTTPLSHQIHSLEKDCTVLNNFASSNKSFLKECVSTTLSANRKSSEKDYTASSNKSCRKYCASINSDRSKIHRYDNYHSHWRSSSSQKRSFLSPTPL